MRRRNFITLLGGAAAAWPLALRAQQSAMPVIGFLHSASPERLQQIVTGFRQGLNEVGYIEGQNVAIVYSWARGQYDRLPALAAEVVQRKVDVIIAGGGEVTARAVKGATSTIPVVFTAAGDPVGAGLVASLSRPGGNLTGLISFTSVVETKKLGLLHDLVPQGTTIAMLINPKFPTAEPDAKEVEAAARILGRKLIVVRASSEQEFEAAFVLLLQEGAGALLVAGDPFFYSQRDQLVALAARHAIPAVYEFRDYVAAGGLMSYGINLPDNYRQMGIYAGKILKGAKPAELPVVQPTKFTFVINLKTAKALGLEVPDKLLALADEVIE
jgi:putative ABC transport system substrate-binding protein